MRIIHHVSKKPIIIVVSVYSGFGDCMLWYFNRKELGNKPYEKDKYIDVGAWRVKYKTK